MCLKVFFVLAAGLALAACSTIAPQQALSMDGRWTLTYSCAEATGLFAQRCAEGDQDFFDLTLWSRDGHLCGMHAASTRMLLKIDEGGDVKHPTIRGLIHDTTATVDWEIYGETGTAMLRRRRGKLLWKVTSEDRRGNVSGGVPAEAVLLRQPANPNDQSRDWPCQ